MAVRTLRVALVGDFDPSVVAHQAIPKALTLGRCATWRRGGGCVGPHEFHLPRGRSVCRASTASGACRRVLMRTRWVRWLRSATRGNAAVPFLGTCGGFQHALLEYARNVCGMPEAEHAETDPDAPLRLIAPLACSLVERSDEILLADGGRFRRAYGQARITEGYHCSYGLNREYESRIFRDGLQATAHDRNGEVRGVELAGHPFFVAALFQPERRALHWGSAAAGCRICCGDGRIGSRHLMAVSVKGRREVYRGALTGSAGRRVCSVRCGAEFRHRSRGIATAPSRRRRASRSAADFVSAIAISIVCALRYPASS